MTSLTIGVPEASNKHSISSAKLSESEREQGSFTSHWRISPREISSSASYSAHIRKHSLLSTKDSLFPGQNYRTLADYLQLPYRNDHYLPKSRDNHSGDFVTLFDLNETPSRASQVPSPEVFEDLIEHQLQQPKCNLLLFLKGHPSPQWLNSIGSKCRIHPEFFQRHVDFWSTIGMPDYFPSPPLPSSSCNTIKLRLTTIGSRGSELREINQVEIDKLRESSSADFARYFHTMRTTDNFQTGDSYVRQLDVYDETHFTIEQDVSICVNTVNNGWIAVIWTDVGSDLSMNPNAALFNSLLDEQITSPLYPIIQYKPENAWSNDIPPELPSTQVNFTQSASLLHRNYGRLLDPELAATDAFYALSELFNFVAHSKRQFLNMVSSKINRELDLLSRSDTVLSLSNLLHYKRVLSRHIQQLQDNISTIESKGSLSNEYVDASEWPQAEEPGQRQHVKGAARRLVRDFRYLLAQAEDLAEQCDKGMDVFMSSAIIAESKRAISQAQGVAKLTFLAFFYIPLNFTCSFFGMNFLQLGTGILSIWIWFAASSVIFGVTLVFMFYDMSKIRDRGWKSIKRLWKLTGTLLAARIYNC